MNIVLREIALLGAIHAVEVTERRHVPGVANILADALSRIRKQPELFAALEDHFKDAKRVPLPERNSEWWLSTPTECPEENSDCGEDGAGRAQRVLGKGMGICKAL